MKLNKFIKQLEGLRREHGGNVEVTVLLDDPQAIPCGTIADPVLQVTFADPELDGKGWVEIVCKMTLDILAIEETKGLGDDSRN